MYCCCVGLCSVVLWWCPWAVVICVQQVSTMAGNQSPSPWIPEVIFILLVATTGLLLLAVLIGSMSNFLQALSRR